MADKGYPRPTLRDVAQLAGVSHMTASRVVRDSRLVKAQTAAKVREAIRATGYRPDPALSALVSYRNQKQVATYHGVIAFLDCDHTAYSQKILKGAEKESRLFGYEIERFSLLESPKSLGTMLFHRGIRGLLLGPSDAPRNFAGWKWEEFATVSLGALEHQPDMHAVAMDYFQGAFTGCERLRQAGYRRIGLIIDPQLEARTGHRWIGGYTAGVEPLEKPRVFRGEISSREAVTRWVKKEKIDAILTIHVCISEFLQGSGIPILFLNDNGSDLAFPRLILQPETIGAEGVRFLHQLLLRHEFGIPKIARLLSLRGAWVNTA